MDLTVQDKFEVLLPKDDIEFLKKFEEMKVRAQVIDDQIKQSAAQFLDEIGQEEYEQDGVRIRKVKDSVRTVVDTKKLKDEGLYELYTKESKVKGGVRISFVYEDEED